MAERGERACALPENLLLRGENAADLPAVLRVVAAAFGPGCSEPGLVELIHQRNHARLGTVALTDRLVGYVLASPLFLDLESGAAAVDLTCLGIAPLAVLPEMQGRSIGSELMRHVIQRACGEGVDALFLLGSPGYYPRFGFRPTHIANAYGATDAFMALELNPGCLGQVRAAARYVSEFSELGV